MKLVSKYGLRDQVWLIGQEREQIITKCTACEGAGEILLKNGKKTSCPECFSRGTEQTFRDLEWQPLKKLTIGLVRIETSNIEPDDMYSNVGHFLNGNTITKVQYMAYETGIGSGKLYKEGLLFPTLSYAQAECDERNNREAAK